MQMVGPRILTIVTVVALACLLPGHAAAQSNEIDALNKRIVELSQAKKYAEAIPLAQRALDLKERTLGRDHPDVAEALLTLARLYRAQGRNADAEALERRAQAMLTALARLYRAQGRNADAEALERRAQAIMQDTALRRTKQAAERQPQEATARQLEPKVMTRSMPAKRPTPPTGGGDVSSGAVGTQALPTFPWPPPRWSARYVLEPSLIPKRATVGDVANAVVAALERTGYVDRSFFRTTDDGVVLVTQLERINDDGTARAENERWPTSLNQTASDLAGYLKGLFFVERGRYRVIVFVLQERPFVQSDKQVAGTEARAWLRTGADKLPPEVADRPYGNSACSVLIYEFESEGKGNAKIVDSRLTARQHLEKAGVLGHLGRAN